MKNYKNYLFVLGFVFLAGCESEPSKDLQDSLSGNSVDLNAIGQTLAINADSQAVGTAATFSDYDPTTSTIPSAIDILFSGTLDGTLNIPIAENDPQEPLKAALNALDGFSTVTPVTTGFTDAIDPASIGPSATNPATPPAVRMFEVGLSQAGGAVVSIKDELTYGVDFAASLASSTTLAVVPLKPLKPKTSYYIVVTNNLKDLSGNSVGSSPVYTLLKDSSATYDDATLELLRQVVSASEFTVDYALEDLSANNIVVSWSFTTQSIGDVLTQVRSIIRAGAVPESALVDSTSDSPLGAADIWVGSLDVPYYLAAATGVNDPAPLSTTWHGAGDSLLSRYNPTPVDASTQSIPLMVSVPKSAMPENGYPVVIYQHGVTANRATMLGVADTFAAQGIAMAAIDMPLHGLTGNETDGTQAFKTSFERTFDLDLVTQDAATGAITALTPDGITDTSGLHFINLQSLLTFRDNGRQAVSDLFTLTYAIDSLSAGDNIFDNSKIYYFGHSAGAMIGSSFVALESNIKDAVIAHAGGYIMKTLDGSSQFSPVLVGGLAAAGIAKGTADYEAFLGVAQAVTDDLDPLNYASTLASKDEGILFFEIIGGNSSPSDLAVPITVPDANDEITGTGPTVGSPLAGSEPLINLLGLTQTNASVSGTNLQLSVKYTAGVHRSMFDPSTDPDVTLEMQSQAASFLFADGNALTVTNTGILEAP